MCHRMRMAFPSFVVDAYNKSQNILIVAEDFDKTTIDFNRLRFYLQPYKKVKVSVTYRRLHDWIPSWYNQIMAHYQDKVYAQGREEYPSFVEWLERNYDKFLDAHAANVAERFGRYDFVDSVHVINMHEVGRSNSIMHFFCDHLRAVETCRAVLDGARPSKSNVGLDHEYERLVVKAKFRGKISANVDRPVVLARTASYMKRRVETLNLTSKLQRVCPGKDILERMVRTEVQQEEKYFPRWHDAQGGEEGLRRSFRQAVEGKFCSFDVERIFESGVLDDIFEEYKLDHE